jgi:hypothetical protein
MGAISITTVEWPPTRVEQKVPIIEAPRPYRIRMRDRVSGHPP